MKKLVVALLVFVITISQLAFPLQGVSSDRLQEKQKEIEELEAKVEELSQKRQTLSSQIAYMNSQIRLTTLRIAKTEEEIEVLSEKIARLEISLNALAVVVGKRIEATYKKGQEIKPIYLLFSSRKFSNFISHYEYLQAAQAHDKKLLLSMEETKINYDEQKQEVENLKKELETQKRLLDRQKKEKEYLLEVTRNDEKHYQTLLAKARAELEAIQSILAGKGEETEVGEVQEGERIATVISGLSACSTGTHLHFEVVVDGAHQNPANFLTPKDVIWDNAPDGPFSFSGSWIWPIEDPVRVTQGYGMTYYARVLNYYRGRPHTGIDIVNSDNLAVKSVKAGILYRGSIDCGGGTLRYMRLKHKDSNIETYYLHINYYK